MIPAIINNGEKIAKRTLENVSGNINWYNILTKRSPIITDIQILKISATPKYDHRDLLIPNILNNIP